MFFHRFFRQWRWMVGAALIALLLPVAVGLTNPQHPSKILPIVQDVSTQSLPLECLPTNLPDVNDPAQDLSFELIARVKADKSEYRMYRASRTQEPGPFPYLIRVVENRCQVLLTNPMGDDNVFLHQVVPLPVARQLALAQLQYSVNKAGGIDTFRTQLEQQLQQTPQSEPLRMPEEEVWAFEQLQLPLPPNVKVVPAPTQGEKR